ncbi:MAG: hypothetical protein AAGA08_18140 [Pseudomonadota bacterium]
MRRTFIASVLSIALAATSFTAAPARADEDVFKVIAGLVVIGALAKAARDHEKRKAARVSRSHQQPVYQKPHRPHKVHRPHRSAKVAPQRCLRDQWTHRGERQVYGARCTQRHANANLPQNCLRQAKTNSGPRFFYTKRCLRDHGWRA